MPFYRVVRKSDSVEVTRYCAGALALLDEYPLAAFDHVEWTPDAPPGYSGPWTITKYAFRERFTNDEKVALELAALDVPDGTLDARAAAAQVRVWLADIEAAQFVDLQLTKTRDGVQALEGYGLLAAGRAAVILDTEPTAEEIDSAN